MKSILLFSLLLSFLFISVYSADVPFKLCSSKPELIIDPPIVASEWPPHKGDTMMINVTGELSKTLTSGEYSIVIQWDGIKLPAITGDIDEFSPLPWNMGTITLHINQDVPSDSPSGSYVLTISATDQDNAQIFCVVVSFDLLDSPGLPTPPHLRIDRSHQHHRMIHNPQGNNMLPQREEKLSPSQEEMVRLIQEKWTRHGQK